MDKALAERWALTLESGNFQQAYGSLRDNEDRCCCLGVLCDIVEPKKWRKRFSYGSFHHRNKHNMPTNAFLKKVGLTYNAASTLAQMNDDGKSFKEIAVYIRRYTLEDMY